jgi:hypothetical protein
MTAAERKDADRSRSPRDRVGEMPGLPYSRMFSWELAGTYEPTTAAGVTKAF